MSCNSVVIYSGGMDSFTLLNEQVVEQGAAYVKALSFDYGQRHKKELTYAAIVCKELNVEHRIVDVSTINCLLQGSALTTSDMDVPEGHYSDSTMKQTVVPNRNMIMLSIAIGYAVSTNSDIVAFAAHSGDHAIYPDCRPEFVEALNGVSFIANYRPVRVEAPYLQLSKGDIAKIGKRMGVDYGRAWTCYKGREKPCGKCGACVERLEALKEAGIVDPLEYE